MAFQTHANCAIWQLVNIAHTLNKKVEHGNLLIPAKELHQCMVQILPSFKLKSRKQVAQNKLKQNTPRGVEPMSQKRLCQMQIYWFLHSQPNSTNNHASHVRFKVQLA